MSGYPWYTNNEIDIQIKPGDTIPNGFHKGRKPRTLESKQKQSNSLKQVYENMSIEEKKEYGLKIKNRWDSYSSEWRENFSKKVSENRKGKGLNNEPWNKGKHNVQIPWNKGLVGIDCGWTEKSAQKQFETRLKNNNFKTKDTDPEKRTLKILLKLFDDNDIIHPYRDEIRYPFNCDFYIKSLDIFIEINSHWTHGKMPFDENNQMCLDILNKWQEKAKTSQFYKNAIETWTIRDVNKLKYAKEYNLNYITIYGRGSSEAIENIILEEISKLRSE